eukprot:gene15963-22095_t
MRLPSLVATVIDCGRDGTASGGCGGAEGRLREEDAPTGKLPQRHGVRGPSHRRRCRCHPSCQLLEIVDVRGQLLDDVEHQVAVSEKKMRQLANFLQFMGDCGRDRAAPGGCGASGGLLMSQMGHIKRTNGREEDALAGNLPQRHWERGPSQRRRCRCHPSWQLLEIAYEMGQLLEAVENQEAVS